MSVKEGKFVNITVRNTSSEEEKRKKFCLEQLALDRQQLLMRWPFIGGVIMRMELVAVRDDRLETASTDGNSIFVDIDFYSTLDKNERLFVLAHEVWHSVLLHFARLKGRNPERFNMATDLEIHFTLADEKMKEPWVLPHDPRWAALSAEEIYEKLEDFSFPQASGSQEPSADDESSNSGSGFDRHIYQGDQLEDPSDTGNNTDPEKTQTDPEPAQFVIDNDYTPQVSSATTEQVRGRVIASAQQVERTQGKLPAHVARLVENILNPILPWQELLKQFVSSCYGGKRRWLPPSRRHVWHDLYLPSMRDEKINAVIAVDTSGSTLPDLGSFFTELHSLMKTFGRYELTLIHCDAAVQKVEKFSDAHPVPSGKMEFKGGGGTDFRPVFDYVNKMKTPPELLIYLTDGYGPAPEQTPPYPVLWVLTQKHNKPCSWGKFTVLE